MFPYYGYELIQFHDTGFFLAFTNDVDGVRADDAGNVKLRKNSKVLVQTQEKAKVLLELQRNLCDEYFDDEFNIQLGTASEAEKDRFNQLLQEIYAELKESLHKDEYDLCEIKTPEPDPFKEKQND